MTSGCELPRGNPAPEAIRALLARARRVAVVGHSDDPVRDSYRVGRFLASKGYEVFPVNPNGRSTPDLRFFPDLRSLPGPVDIVDIFRRVEFIPAIVDDAIRAGAKAIWMQDGLAHNASAEKARAAGLEVVMSRCMMRDYRTWQTELDRARS
ncbi:MAG TPA: CoA-binding protein [Candidatus Polarisedimenticolia bacterium]|nr:CoA-binding protein [Candidatus Polarisedimenticolia bacterium]